MTTNNFHWFRVEAQNSAYAEDVLIPALNHNHAIRQLLASPLAEDTQFCRISATRIDTLDDRMAELDEHSREEAS